MVMARKAFFTGLLPLLGWAITSPAQAIYIGNVQGGTDFPQGALSFADAVVSYSPVIKSGQPTSPHRGASNALGLPDYTVAGQGTCASQASCPWVALGDGGNIVLRFDDNWLTGSDDAALDLWIFEVGPDVEETFVQVSEDGASWTSVGKIGGSTAGIDIDAYGFTSADRLSFVRLRDDPDRDGQTGVSVGADFDAVGAVSTIPIPEPSTALLLIAGLAGLAVAGRRRRSLH
jgi:hypothetical protein